MSDPGDSWKALFFAGAVLLVLFRIWRGWRLGVVRQVASLLTLAVAYAAAVLGGRAVAPLLHSWLPYPELILSAIGGAVIGTLVLLVGTGISAMLFKRTSQQSVGLVRLGYGVFGALVGAFYGVALVALAVVGVRLLGTVAEAQVAADKHATIGAPHRPQPAMMRNLAELKQSLGDSSVGAAVEKIDPVPEDFYGTLQKVGQMASDPKSVERFSNYPGVRPLLDHPKMLELFRDPEITRAAIEHNYLQLLSSRRVLETVGDPELGELLRNLELQKALDYALRKPDNGPPRTAR